MSGSVKCYEENKVGYVIVTERVIWIVEGGKAWNLSSDLIDK